MPCVGRVLDAEIKANQETINQLEIQIEATTAEQREIDANVEKTPVGQR